jgi:hypothetical protein
VPSRPCPRGRAVLEAKTARLAVMQPVKAVKMAASAGPYYLENLGPQNFPLLCDV